MAHITRRDHSKVFQLPTTVTHTFQLREFVGHVMELSATHFHSGSAVVLADHGVRDTARPEAMYVTALSVARSAYLHAQGHPAQKLIVTGHVQGRGEGARTLSQLRADAFRSILEGDRDLWIASVKEHNTPQDVQHILTWIHRAWSLDGNPGSVGDDPFDPVTRGAVTRFKKAYNEEFDKSLPLDDAIDARLWGAFFDVYMEVLAGFMGVADAVALAAFRGTLKYVDDGRKSVGCGSNHGLDAVRQAGFARSSSTRVELCFFEPADLPLRDCHPTPTECVPDACEVYSPVMFRWDVLPVMPADPLPKLKITLSLGEIDAIFPKVIANTHTDPGVRQRLQAIGWLNERFDSRDIAQVAEDAWKHFKTELKLASDAAAVAELTARVKNTIVDQGTLPPKGGFGKLRLPGSWCIAYAAEYVNGNGYIKEEIAWQLNPSLGRVPILARVEVRRKGFRPAVGQVVHFQFVAPDALPAGHPLAAPPLRFTPARSTYPNGFFFAMTGSPGRYVTDQRSLHPPVAVDPFVDNAHNSLGGKRGNPVVGADVTKNLLEVATTRPQFNTALKLKVCIASSRPAAVRAETNERGEAAAIFMPSRQGGDRYKLRASVHQISGRPSDGADPHQVADETGTFVVWRMLRLSKYLRWAYPPGSEAKQELCGGPLNDLDLAGVVAEEFKKSWLDVELETEAIARHDITQAEWQAALRYARARAVKHIRTLQKYDLAALLPDTDATGNNDSPGVLRFVTPEQYDAATKSLPPPDGGWHRATRDLALWYRDMQAIFAAVREEFMHFFTRNALSGLTVLQAGSMSSHLPDNLPSRPEAFNKSGFEMPSRGSYVVFGDEIYQRQPYNHNRNTLHELGHLLYGAHQYTMLSEVNRVTSSQIDAHDYHDLCIMGYVRCPGEFCGRCVMKQAGWDTSKLTPNHPGP